MGNFLVQKNETEELYLQPLEGNFPPQWGSDETAMEFNSMAEAEGVATYINAGSLGVPKKP